MHRSSGASRVVLALACACAATATVLLAGAQTPSPAFDVAVVKRTGVKVVVPFQVRPGHVVATSVTLRPLILRAYNVKSWNLVGAPDWTNEERFDLEATFQEPATPDQVNAMLRTLLERRFRLVAHSERREMNTDVLILAAAGHPGPGLHPVRVDCATKLLLEGSGPGLFAGQRPACNSVVRTVSIGSGAVTPQTSREKLVAHTMEQFADHVAGVRGRPAADRTGLTGQFDIELTYVTDQNAVLMANAGAAIDAPRFDVALREQLGIRLQQERNQVEQLIVTSVELPRAEEN